MIGRTFGKWKVLNEVDKSPGKHYECQCDCGEFAIIPGNTLRAGRSTKCKLCMYNERFNPMQMVGKKFGNWEVIEYLGIKNRYHSYKTRCICGTEGNHYSSDLRSGKTRQCIFCHNKELSVKNTKHGMHNSSIYRTWKSMINRCENVNSTSYRWYGARGIKVCERWRESFESFLEDMEDRPPGMTLDRINNDGDYEPSNCRWVTHQENCNNRGIYNDGKKRKSKVRNG